QIIVDFEYQIVTTITRQSGNLKHRTFPAEALDKILDALGALFSRHHIELVKHQPTRFVKQRFVVFLELLDDGFGFLDRINLIEWRKINDMQQQPCTLQVSQELMPQPGTVRCTFDQARNIGNHETFFMTYTHHTQIRMQSGEWIIGNLGACIRHCSDESRLARIRHTQQTNVCQYFQLKTQFTPLAFLAFGLLTWSTIGG